jgi:hypothetical protein
VRWLAATLAASGLLARSFARASALSSPACAMFSPSHAQRDKPPSEPWDGACNAADSAAFAAAHASRTTPGHFRRSAHLLRGAEAVNAHSVTLSSLGVGTYLGRPDDATDAAVSAAVRASIDAGWNVIDSAINYRHERGERAIGAPGAVRCGYHLWLPASAAAFHLPDASSAHRFAVLLLRRGAARAAA